MGLLAPVTALISRDKLTLHIDSVNTLLRQEDLEVQKTSYREILDKTVFNTREAIPPLERIEAALHPWVAFLIMPLFALANAAVPIKLNQLGETLTLAVCLGLVFGKPIGILVSSYIMVRLKLADLPVNVNWRMLLGAGCLAGIGFTMSLFIASLSLDDAVLNTAKSGIIIGSFVSIILGIALLLPKRQIRN
jgi:NhaA family Na+:H+ antiporter